MYPAEMGALSQNLHFQQGQICPLGKLKCSCQLHLSCAALCEHTKRAEKTYLGLNRSICKYIIHVFPL